MAKGVLDAYFEKIGHQPPSSQSIWGGSLREREDELEKQYQKAKKAEQQRKDKEAKQQRQRINKAVTGDSDKSYLEQLEENAARRAETRAGRESITGQQRNPLNPLDAWRESRDLMESAVTNFADSPKDATRAAVDTTKDVGRGFVAGAYNLGTTGVAKTTQYLGSRLSSMQDDFAGYRQATGQSDPVIKGSDIEEAGKVAEDYWQEKISESRFDPESPENQNLATKVGYGASTLAGAVAISVATKNPTAASVAFGSLEAGDFYTAAREAGLDRDTANNYATASGASTAILEKLGLDRFFEAGAGNVASRFIGGAIVESVQEASQTASSNFWSKMSYDEQRKWYEGVAEAALIGGIVGGVGRAALPGSATNSLIKPLKGKGLSDDEAQSVVDKVVADTSAPVRVGIEQSEVAEQLLDQPFTRYISEDDMKTLEETGELPIGSDGIINPGRPVDDVNLDENQYLVQFTPEIVPLIDQIGDARSSVTEDRIPANLIQGVQEASEVQQDPTIASAKETAGQVVQEQADARVEEIEQQLTDIQQQLESAPEAERPALIQQGDQLQAELDQIEQQVVQQANQELDQIEQQEGTPAAAGQPGVTGQTGTLETAQGRADDIESRMVDLQRRIESAPESERPALMQEVEQLEQELTQFLGETDQEIAEQQPTEEGEQPGAKKTAQKKGTKKPPVGKASKSQTQQLSLEEQDTQRAQVQADSARTTSKQGRKVNQKFGDEVTGIADDLVNSMVEGEGYGTKINKLTERQAEGAFDYLATTVAEELRTMDQELGDVHKIPRTDAIGGDSYSYVRASTNSQFYRQFYKANKRAPTKGDYLDEAHRLLKAGQDDRSGIYNKLREKIADDELDEQALEDEINNIKFQTDGSDTLHIEARKYDTAEEFIEAQQSDYRGSHQAPGRDDYNAPAHNLTGGEGIYPDDIYTDPQAYRYYGHGGGNIDMDKKSIELLRSIKGKPNAKVTIYRAVPESGSINEIKAGDWVTLNRDYAVQHGEAQFDGGKILEMGVKASDIFTDGNSIHEFGYDPATGDTRTEAELRKIYEEANQTEETDTSGEPKFQKAPKSIHWEDQKEMVDFIDAVRLPGRKPTHEQEISASRIAEHYNLPMPKSRSALANGFDKALQLQRVKTWKNPNWRPPKQNRQGEDTAKYQANLTTSILEQLGDRKTVSKQFVADMLNQKDIKQGEKNAIRKVLEEQPDTISVQSFVNDVKTQLLPLVRNKVSDPKYTSTNVPSNMRKGSEYAENIYESPIENFAGGIHFHDFKTDNYFAHTRHNDYSDSREIIEIQSDLMQKGHYKRELSRPNIIAGVLSSVMNRNTQWADLTDFQKQHMNQQDALPAIDKDLEGLRSIRDEADPQNQLSLSVESSRDIANDLIDKLESFRKDVKDKGFSKRPAAIQEAIDRNNDDLSKIEAYKNTWFERIIREELHHAATDGKSVVRIPTGETAMSIEGLGRDHPYSVLVGGRDGAITDGSQWQTATVDNVQPRDTITNAPRGIVNEIEDQFLNIVTSVSEDGYAKVIQRRTIQNHPELKKIAPDRLKESIATPEAAQSLTDSELALLDKYAESINITKELDYNNPIYKFYENDIQKFLNKIRPDLERVTDDNDMEWFQTTITEDDFAPIQAFQEQQVEGTKAVEPKVARALANQILGADVPIQFVNSIATPDGANAYGQYHKGVLTFAAKVKDTTYGHEIAHYLVENAMTEQQWEGFKQELDIADNALAEEDFAERMGEYVNNRTGNWSTRLKQMFDDLWNTVKRIVRRHSDIQAFFKQAYEGKFSGEVRVPTGVVARFQEQSLEARLARAKENYSNSKAIGQATAKTPEELQETLQQLKKVLRAGAVPIKSTQNMGAYAHELAHAIEQEVAGKVGGKTLSALGSLTDSERKTVRDEMKAITESMVGREMVESNPSYFNSDSEIFARYLESYIKEPTKIADKAPVTTRKFDVFAAQNEAVDEFIKSADRALDTGIEAARQERPSEPTGTPEGTPKVSKLAKGVEAKAVENKLTEGFGRLAEYSSFNMETQAQKAADLLASDPERAKDIAMGRKQPPEGLLPESVFVAVEQQAVENNDSQTSLELATVSSITTGASIMGARIRTLRERISDSPVDAIQAIQQERDTRSRKGRSGRVRRKAEIQEKNKVKKSMKKTTPKLSKVESFIDSLEC